MVLIGAQGGVCYIEGRNINRYHAPNILMLDKPINNLDIERASDGNSRQKDCGSLKVRLSTRSMETLMPIVKKFLIKLNETLAPPARNIRFYIFRFLLYVGCGG
uniref:Uncharacterized protein n=1 Tax=Ditylenchus dipsaci TaxID=166011 RepID=A0A915ED76_9BILA